MGASKFTICDTEDAPICEISRAEKSTPLYEIHYPLAESGIGWNQSRKVGYTEALLFVFALQGETTAHTFQEWADQMEKMR